MSNTAQISCIIPFFNEEQRIFSVLEVISSLKEVAQIICVDDGSTDGTADLVEQNWPQVAIIRLPHNQGKTAAIRRGLKVAKHDYVLLMDADLQFINPSEISFAIHAMAPHQADMIILRRIRAPWFVKMDRGDVLFSGERILKRTDLEAILRSEIKGYQLEIAINEYMLTRAKEVYWVPSSASNTFKMQKIGRLEGSIKELNMYFDIVFFAGIQNYIRQIASFARKPITHLPPASMGQTPDVRWIGIRRAKIRKTVTKSTSEGVPIGINAR